jgi:hypothetical protein
MGKYDPLKSFLVSQPGDHIRMTFGDIEQVLGSPLPNSKKYPAWWSNNPSNNTMTHAWLDAGFSTEQVDTAAERLVFRRTRPPRHASEVVTRLRDRLAGTVTFAPRFDPTDPTGEIWDAER